MAGSVIQGFFVGGTRLVQRSAPRAAQPVGGPGPPPPSFDRARAVQQRPAPGPPAPLAGGNVVQPFADGTRFAVDPAAIGLARSGGRSLPAALLAKMEAAFQADFSAVRVHIGPQAVRIGALAFTTGNDLYFAPGQFQPDSVKGQQLIGHELTHVIQQRQGRVPAPDAGVAVVQDRALEAEADRTGMRAAMHLSAGASGRTSTVQPKLLRPGDVRGPARLPGPPPAAFGRAPNVVQRSSSSTATYTLTGDKPQQVLLEALGQFVFQQTFTVSPGAAGIIIQRIRRKLVAYDVWGSTHTLLSTAEVEKFKSSAGKFVVTGWDDYYECFDVDAKGNSLHADSFALTMINPDTNHTSGGQYVISGEAYFVAGGTLGSDWKKGDSKNPANGLPFIQSASSASSLPAPESNVLKREVAVTWYKSADAVLKVDNKQVLALKGGAFPVAAPIQP